MRPLAELLSPEDEGWQSFRGWSSESPRAVEVLPPDTARRDVCLLRLQVTTRSVMGALAWHTGGVLVDERWLRLLGGVSREGLPDLATASGVERQPPPFMVVALDVVGGRFAVNGGGLPGEPGEVAYFGPDTLAWEPLGQRYSGFVAWALTGDLAAFYADLRWAGWEENAKAVPASSLLSSYPPLFTEQAREDRAGLSRRAVPWHEVIEWQGDMARQLADVPEGSAFTVTTDDQQQ